MRLFVSEFVVGGAAAKSDVPASMRREGMAMLRAVMADVARIPGWSAVTTLEKGETSRPIGDVIFVEDAVDERATFRRLLTEVDAVLVIAPETDGVLAERCRQVRAAGVASWNCTPAAIDLCGDKLSLARHLQNFGLPTIPTAMADIAQDPSDQSGPLNQGAQLCSKKGGRGAPSSEAPVDFQAVFGGFLEARSAPATRTWPLVLKPRDGAGSCLTFLVRNQDEWDQAIRAFEEAGTVDKCLMQPLIVGRALSMGVNISFDGKRVECLPVGEQHLSDDGRFQYLGGMIPAGISTAANVAIKEIVVNACRTIPGVAGYIGIDLLLTNTGEPLIVEINPRLTTAYVGYRQLYSRALPQRWLSSMDEPLIENSRVVEFQA